MMPCMATRDRLLAAAEQLFGNRGVDGVSLREIQRASGAKNGNALQYHFGDRAGLLTALLDKHSHDVDQRRHALLDRYESVAENTLRPLAEALVLPIAAKLADGDGGAAYLRVYADMLSSRQQTPETDELQDQRDSLMRWRTLVDPFLDPVAARLHRRLLVIRFVVSELAVRSSTGPHTDDSIFVSQLTDLAAALLAAPPSAETRHLTKLREDAKAADRHEASS